MKYGNNLNKLDKYLEPVGAFTVAMFVCGLPLIFCGYLVWNVPGNEGGLFNRLYTALFLQSYVNEFMVYGWGLVWIIGVVLCFTLASPLDSLSIKVKSKTLTTLIKYLYKMIIIGGFVGFLGLGIVFILAKMF